MTDLEGWLAAQARALGLNAQNVEYTDPEVLRAYCVLVLSELTARGVLTGQERPGCYAAAREGTN
ncbi:hypothetical protein [Deinococcus sp.]|uniref:hypothetical protein n=1 Tax=Deinococcus sp. TaxID=47478 RepID=UPI003C7CBD26